MHADSSAILEPMGVTDGRPDDRFVMKIQFQRWGIALWLGAMAHAQAATATPDETPPGSGKTSAQACEAAVTEAIQKARGRNAQTVQFITPKNAQPTQSPDEAHVKGQGRYQGASGAMPFTYSCTVNPQTHETSGVVFRETGVVSRPPAEAPWQADLTHLSPEVCEAAAAAALKEQFPRVVNIVLASNARQLKPAPGGHTYLLGQGTLERAVGMQAVAFTYRCELETVSGKLVGVQTDLVE